MANTFFGIASNSLSSSAAYIEFTSIPQTYDDLYCVVSLRADTSTTGESLVFRLNGSDTSSSFIGLTIGSSTTASSNTFVNNGSMPGTTSTADIFGNAEIYIANYAGSKYKPFGTFSVNENNSATFPSETIKGVAGIKSDTATITSLRISCVGGNWIAGSRADLYGIKNT